MLLSSVALGAFGCDGERSFLTIRVAPDAGAEWLRLLVCTENVPRYDELIPVETEELVVAFEPMGGSLAGSAEVLVQVLGTETAIAESRSVVRLAAGREEELAFSADCLRMATECPPAGPPNPIGCDERLPRCVAGDGAYAPDGIPCQDGVCVRGACVPDVVAFYPFDGSLRDATGVAPDGRVIRATLDSTSGTWRTVAAAPVFVEGTLRLESGGPDDTEGDGFLPGGDESALAGLAADCRFTFATRVRLGADPDGWIVAEHARVFAENTLTGLPALNGTVEGFFRGDAPRPPVQTGPFPVLDIASIALVGDGESIRLWVDGTPVGVAPEIAPTLSSTPCMDAPFRRLVVGHLARSEERNAFVSADVDYLLLADEPLPDSVLESLGSAPPESP